MIVRAAWIAVTIAAACAGTTGPQITDPPERSEPLVFSNEGITFNGTLWLPTGEGPHPAVVLVGGNGPWRPAHWYFDILRDVFRARGIAVAYYDRRGEAGTGGDFDRATFEQLADDASAAVNAARGSAGIDPRRVGIWGHSMGGWIAGLAASRSPFVAFVITAAGPGVGPLDQTLFARENEDRAAGFSEADVGAMSILRRKIVEYYVFRAPTQHAESQALFDAARQATWFPTAAAWPELRGVGAKIPSPETLAAIDSQGPDVLRWFRRDGLFDPSQAHGRINVPYLSIFGESDTIVPLGPSVAALERGIPASRLTVRTYANANHMIMTGPARELAALAAGYPAGMADWVSTVPGR